LATSQPVYTVSGEADLTPFTLDAENPAGGMSVSITSEGIQGAGACSLQLDMRLENPGIESALVNLWFVGAPWDGEWVPVVPSEDTGLDTGEMADDTGTSDDTGEPVDDTGPVPWAELMTRWVVPGAFGAVPGVSSTQGAFRATCQEPKHLLVTLEGDRVIQVSGSLTAEMTVSEEPKEGQSLTVEVTQ
jgi:hypothetical protein